MTNTEYVQINADPENRGAWGERFEYEGDKFDPSDESLPEDADD